MWNDAVVVSADLTLTSTYQNVQAQGGGDLVISLGSPYEVVTLHSECDFQSSPTDDCEFEVFGSVDGTNYAAQPVQGLKFNNTTDPNGIVLPISGYKKLKVRARQTGSTDTTNTFRVRYDKGE